MEEKISFSHDGARYAMTEAEIEAAYRYREHQVKMEDAMRQLEIFVFGTELDALDEEEAEQSKQVFEQEHGVSFDEVSTNEMLEKYVERYLDDHCCNIDDDSQWQNVIEQIIDEAAG